jgi:hypothetical protein
VAVIAVCSWLFRDAWWPRVQRLVGGKPSAVEAPLAAGWQPVSDAGAERARKSIESLSRRSGPVFANVAPGDLASYVVSQLTRQLPASAQDLEAAVIGDRVYVRATINVADLGRNALGPLAGIFGDREPVQFGGTFDVVRPGLAEFAVQDLKVKEFSVPKTAIAKLMRQVDRGAHRDSVAANAFALEIPPYIGDIRVGRGRVTVYKSVP